MKKLLKYFLILLVLTAIVIQFINRPEKISLPVTESDMIVSLRVNPEMADMIKNSCYDCHSNQPRYPWYASVAPVSWWVTEHIEHGRDELNFSDWATFSKRRRDHKLEEMVEEVEEGHMPLPSYLRMHRDAKLSDSQIEALKEWVEAERAKIEAESN